ncbi:hypothetical protein [Beggiatoa leptomitoformis]|uniref:ParB/Sulfiredoxin domain-containing protein n=1 Tax=Beggiatoa leptomitoformis TaxID=288004 RepID=A0A2N9YIK2_9GAMM|nr:hypothetical protein [Beggiatoa leptomitoformis]AUI70320.1 hypothetical protein BLE401_17525 [Beggiatoa leptomitoformis]QGX03614.1 hypothetical protein AL038_18740 [Beggiatoa leptomitoformis]
MSKLSPAIVLVKNIHCTLPRDTFSAADIEAGAHLILHIEGVINPLILRREGMEHYTIVEGHLEYYAALRSRELDLSRGETINAYIIEAETEETILQQISLFRKKSMTTPATSVNAERFAQATQHLAQLDKLAHLFTVEIQQLQTTLAMLAPPIATFPTPNPEITPLQAEIPVVSTTPEPIQPTTELIATTPPPKKPKTTRKTVQTLPVKTDSTPVTVEKTGKKSERTVKTTPAITPKSVEIPVVSEIIPTIPVKAEKTPKKPAKSTKASIALDPEEEAFLNKLNALPDKDLQIYLARLKIQGDMIDALLKARPFQTVADIQTIKSETTHKGMGKAQLNKLKAELK